jgi:hypothetical protein
MFLGTADQLANAADMTALSLAPHSPPAASLAPAPARADSRFVGQLR